jgi:hypothetical protein
MDKYFEARDRLNGFGTQTYLEDVNRTYHKLPPRNDSTYERALRFREEEKEHVNALVEENTIMRERIQRYCSVARDAKQEIDWQRDRIYALNSKLNNMRNNGSTTDRRNDGSDSRVPDVQSTTISANNDTKLPGEVLPSGSVPDPRGQSGEHSDEGRQINTDAGSVGPASSDVHEE